MLYLVATPIGNLADITFRAIEVLKTCDYILCEDTRHSLILLKHYGLQKPLKSFHKFSEAMKEDPILADLSAGKTIALICNAGTPGISDPGTRLVQSCKKQGIQVTAIPGPCAAISAISSSGLDTDHFQFIGFLPKKDGQLTQALQSILPYPGTSICYESPHRLKKVLKKIDDLDPQRILAVARELTKIYEENLQGTANELLNHFEKSPLKGEIVLMISGCKNQTSEWAHLPPEKHVQLIQETHGIPLQDAIKMAAKQRGVPKRAIYNLLHTPA